MEARGSSGYRFVAAYSRREAEDGDSFDCSPERYRKNVLRYTVAQSGACMDETTVRHDEFAGHSLYGRDFRLLPASGESPIKKTSSHTTQAGQGLWSGSGLGHTEPCRP